MCMDFIWHRRRILWNLSLKGSWSVTLISCFTKSVQTSSPGSREKMSWYPANRAQAAAWFPSDHHPTPDRSSCWKRVSFLHSTDILICWLPWSSVSRVPGVNFTGGTTFVATTWVTLMPLVMVIRVTVRFLTTAATPLLPVVTLVYRLTTLSPWGKQCPSSLLDVWVITCMLLPRRKVFIWPYVILDEKVSISFLLVVLTTSIKLVGSPMGVSLLIESSAGWHVNNWAILNPLKDADNSYILLSLIILMILLMVGVPRITSTQDPKVVESGSTRATWSSL